MKNDETIEEIIAADHCNGGVTLVIALFLAAAATSAVLAFVI